MSVTFRKKREKNLSKYNENNLLHIILHIWADLSLLRIFNLLDLDLCTKWVLSLHPLIPAAMAL